MIRGMANQRVELSTQKTVELHKTVAEPLTLEDLHREGVTLSVDRASRYIGVSRAYCYAMVKEGRLPVIKVGNRRVRVITAGLLRMLSGEA